MEKVFWLMWLSDFVGDIEFIGSLAAFGASISICILAVLAYINEVDSEGWRRTTMVLRWLAIPVLIALITPNKDAVRLLAIASAADAAASTQIGQKGLKSIDAILDGVISGVKKTDK